MNFYCQVSFGQFASSAEEFPPDLLVCLSTDFCFSARTASVQAGLQNVVCRLINPPLWENEERITGCKRFDEECECLLCHNHPEYQVPRAR